MWRLRLQDHPGRCAGRGVIVMALRSVPRARLTRAGLAAVVLAGAVVIPALIGGCRAAQHRAWADKAAYDIIAEKQRVVFGEAEPFSIATPAQTLRRQLMLDQGLPHADAASVGTQDVEPIKQWPDPDYLTRSDEPDALVDALSGDDTLTVSLEDALQIGAHESREYQAQKESVFETALRLDLERDAFRLTWSGVLDGLAQAELESEIVIDDRGNTDTQTVGGVEYGGVLGVSQRLKNGLSFTGQVGLDLVSLLTQDKPFAQGVYGDATITLPLMRGSGEFVVTEPLTQAERNVVYALYDFERFKREFAVSLASEYFAVLRQLDSVENAQDNYERLIVLTRRTRSLAEAGRTPEIQVDQSRQDELRARNQWISAQEAYRRQLDSFKLTLGLPVDARVELVREELDRIRASHQDLITPPEEVEVALDVPPADAPVELPSPGQGGRGPYEIEEALAVPVALTHRLDLRVAIGQVHDTQRTVAVAADQLRADVTLLGSGNAGAQRSLGSVRQEDSDLRPDHGVYSALLSIDLPLERTSEQVSYRTSLIRFEQAVRDVQALEDRIKLDVRNGLSRLLEGRESIVIQAEAVKVARRRVASTSEFLEAGRAEVRDVLEAQDALVTAQNALTEALVSYRVNELALQRDLGVLAVDHRGLWHEPTLESEED